MNDSQVSARTAQYRDALASLSDNQVRAKLADMSVHMERLIEAGDSLYLRNQMYASLVKVLTDGRTNGASATRMVDATIKTMTAIAEGRTTLADIRPLPDAVYGREKTDETYRQAAATQELIKALAGIFG